MPQSSNSVKKWTPGRMRVLLPHIWDLHRRIVIGAMITVILLLICVYSGIMLFSVTTTSLRGILLWGLHIVFSLAGIRVCFDSKKAKHKIVIGATYYSVLIISIALLSNLGSIPIHTISDHLLMLSVIFHIVCISTSLLSGVQNRIQKPFVFCGFSVVLILVSELCRHLFASAYILTYLLCLLMILITTLNILISKCYQSKNLLLFLYFALGFMIYGLVQVLFCVYPALLQIHPLNIILTFMSDSFAVSGEASPPLISTLTSIAAILVFEKFIDCMTKTVCEDWNVFTTGELHFQKIPLLILINSYFFLISYVISGHKTFTNLISVVTMLLIAVCLFWVKYPLMTTRKLSKAVAHHILLSADVPIPLDVLTREYGNAFRAGSSQKINVLTLLVARLMCEGSISEQLVARSSVIAHIVDDHLIRYQEHFEYAKANRLHKGNKNDAISMKPVYFLAYAIGIFCVPIKATNNGEQFKYYIKRLRKQLDSSIDSKNLLSYLDAGILSGVLLSIDCIKKEDQEDICKYARDLIADTLLSRSKEEWPRTVLRYMVVIKTSITYSSPTFVELFAKINNSLNENTVYDPLLSELAITFKTLR